MDRRTLLASMGVGVAGSLAGCSFGSNSGKPPAASAALEVRVVGRGEALSDFSSLTLHVGTVGLDPQSGSAGEVPSGAAADLTGDPKAVLTTRFPAEQYARFSLHGSVASATATDGSSPDVRMPHAGLEYDYEYSLQPGKTVVITAPVHVGKTGSGTYALTADTGDVSSTTKDSVPTSKS